MFSRILASTIIAASAATSYGQQRPSLEGLPEILRLAVSRADSLRYTGVRVVNVRARGPQRETVEYITRDGDRIRIDFPNDSAFSGQVIIEDPTERRHYLPGQNEVRVLPPRRGESLLRLVASLARFRQERKVSVENGSLIAGRLTRLLLVADQRGNPLQKLYIDPTTGAVLKSEVYDFVGTSVGSYEFKSIEFKDKIDSRLFKVSRKGLRTVSPQTEANELTTKLNLRQIQIPREFGFRLESARVIRPEGEPILAQMFTSNTGRLTVFQTRADLKSDRLSKFARGEISTRTWRVGGINFAVIGPKSTNFDRVADRLKRDLGGQ